jgi:hypothetical protein
MTSRLSALLRLLFLGAALTAAGAGSLSAQTPAPVPAPQTQPGGGGGGGGSGAIIEDDTSGLYFEWALLAIGVGVALFAVCRSSRRN